MKISFHRAGHRRCARHIATVLLLAAGAAACGSQAADTAQVASLGTDAPTPNSGSSADAPDGTATGDTATSDSTPIDPADAMLEYAQCMREHGVDMPDPHVDADGNGAIVISGSTGADATPGTGVVGPDPAFEEAQQACQSIMDAIASSDPIDPEVLAEQREQMLDFAQCMREHGIDMPDPVFGDDGSISIQVGDPNGGDGAPAPDDDVWQEANTACSEILGTPGDGGMSVVPAGGMVPVGADAGSTGIVIGASTSGGDTTGAGSSDGGAG